MAFLEHPRFPTDINYGVVGGPVYKTNIVEKNSGHENANSVWPEGRHEYDLIYAAKDQLTIERLLTFFHAIKGRAQGFRFKDFTDFKSCSIANSIACTDQILLRLPDKSNRYYQLVKRYTYDANHTTIRLIKKPVKDTIITAVNGKETTEFSADFATGILEFYNLPQKNVVITAGFEFDVPVRFMSDTLQISIDSDKTRSVHNLGLIEVRL